MSTTEVAEKRAASDQAVNEEYEKLARFQVNHRKLVFPEHKDPPEGSFGVVLHAELHQSVYLPAWLASRWYGPPQLVAVKQIKGLRYNVRRVKRAFTREMLVWSSLEAHPGIAKFLGFYADFKCSEAWLLSPWEPNGNVSEFIKANNLEVPEKLSLVYDTIDALTFLHEFNPPVCHGDIKSANVLVSADFKARLCDFGLALLHESSGFKRLETSTGAKGSIRWNSPEIIEGAKRAPTSDVYAWAWLVWEIMTGDLPYEGTSNDYAIICKIFESPLPEVDGQSRLSDCLQLWELMTRCWNADPLQRPTASMCKTTVTHLPRCTPNADHQTRSAALLENLGDLESWKGNLEKSSAYLDEAMRLYQEEADTRGIASVLRKQAAAAYRITDCVKLRAIATTALEHCRTLNDALGIADASYYLGFSLERLNELDMALPRLRESLEIRRTHADDAGAVLCLERIGIIQVRTHQDQEALSTLGEAVAIASRSGDQLGLAIALDAVGYTHSELSDFAKAADAFSEAIAIARNIGWKGGLATILVSMGNLKMRLGDLREAEQLLQESVSTARHVRDRWRLATSLETLGECFQIQSNLQEAASALEEAYLLWHELSQQGPAEWVASALVKLKRTQGDWDGELFWEDTILTACRSQKKYLELADHLQQKGEIMLRMQRFDEVALYFEAAMQTRWENGYFPNWKWEELRRQLCAIPKTTMKWERRLPLLSDLKKLQRRQPQLGTASLWLPIPIGRGES